MRTIMCTKRTRKNSMDTLFGAVETLYCTLPSPDNRWPTYQQKKRLYERAMIKVLLQRLDDAQQANYCDGMMDETTREVHKATLKMLHEGLLTIEDTNPNAPGIRESIEILEDLLGGNYDG